MRRGVLRSEEARAARPHVIRSAIATVVALGGLVLAYSTIEVDGGVIGQLKLERSSASDLLPLLGAVLFLVAGIIAVRAISTALKHALEVRLGDARGAPVALGVATLGYLLILLPTLELLGVDLGGLLVGGAITGVVVGIAAQQTLANFFAGLVLLLVRPFTLGQHILLRSGPLGGEYEGRITDMGLFYVRMMTDQGSVQLPNSGVLAAAIGPGAAQSAQKDPERDETPE